MVDILRFAMFPRSERVMKNGKTIYRINIDFMISLIFF